MSSLQTIKLLLVSEEDLPLEDIARLALTGKVKVIDLSDVNDGTDIMSYFNSGCNYVFINIKKYRTYYQENKNALPKSLSKFFIGKYNEKKHERIRTFLEIESFIEALPKFFSTAEELIKKLSSHIPRALFSSRCCGLL